jgi:3-hydroxybutyrate dehydrogenase
MKLQNKVSVITGSTSGLGHSIAEKFASEGSDVVIVGRRVEQGQKIAADIEKKYSVKALFVQMDVSDEKMVEDGFAKIIDTFKKIDILVSNAGIQIIHPFEDFPFNEWKKLVDIHLHGSFLTSQAAMRAMKKTGGGRIIFMGSVHSFEASIKKAAYIASKHALLGMNRALAKEGAKFNITSNLIAPGFVKTPLVIKQIPEQAKLLGISEEDVVKKIMLGQTVDGEFTTLDDVSNVALFFAAFPTNALTGQSLIVSHGWSMS